jgi:hypothetical protein
VVSSNQGGKCGKRGKLQVTRSEVTPKICGLGVGRVFKTHLNQVINNHIHTYPQLIPRLGVELWGELFNI